MVISLTTAAWFLPFVLPIAIWVAWSDMATMKIPNKAVLALIAVFVIVGLIALPFEDYLWRYAHFAVILAIGFVMSTVGMMGAGDAKFAAAMAPFIALPDAFSFSVLLAGVTAVALLLHRVARGNKSVRARFPNWVSWTHKGFPMGFALAPALVFYLAIPLFTG